VLPSTPSLDPKTQRLDERFAGLAIEEVATESRAIAEALRIWSAETGVQHADVNLLGMTMHAGEQILSVDPFVLLDQVDQSISLGVDGIGHGLVLGIDGKVLVAKGRIKPHQLAEFTARQQQVVKRIKDHRVTIETNISSNTEISNLTQGEHPAGLFAKKGLRVTVNTDDETVLATTIQKEFERVAQLPGVTRIELATMILEAYRSRLGNRELSERGRLKPQLLDALLRNLSSKDARELSGSLATRFNVLPASTPRDTLARVLDTTLGR
jgi:adenosine deaminase